MTGGRVDGDPGFALIAVFLSVAAWVVLLSGFGFTIAAAAALAVAAAGSGMVELNASTGTRGARVATGVGVSAAAVATTLMLADALNATRRPVNLHSAFPDVWLWSIMLSVFGTTFIVSRALAAAGAAFVAQEWKPRPGVALAALAALGVAALDVLLLVALERVL